MSAAAGKPAAYGEGTVVITRTFDMPRAQVWRAWTDPKMLSQWFGPRGFTSSVPQWELRVGGALRIDRARLVAVVEPVVFAHGAELVDLELKNESGWILRLFVEKAGSADKNASTQDAAINLELCADISRDLSPALDVADLIPARYNLEVSSPGVERPLKSERDFRRFEGQKAKLRLTNPVAGQKVVVGKLGHDGRFDHHHNHDHFG